MKKSFFYIANTRLRTSPIYGTLPLGGVLDLRILPSCILVTVFGKWVGGSWQEGGGHESVIDVPMEPGPYYLEVGVRDVG
jgi:hypothetical protein